MTDVVIVRKRTCCAGRAMAGDGNSIHAKAECLQALSGEMRCGLAGRRPGRIVMVTFDSTASVQTQSDCVSSRLNQRLDPRLDLRLRISSNTLCSVPPDKVCHHALLPCGA